MGSKRIEWKTVGFALLPAVGVSIAVMLLGSLAGVADSAVDRVSTILFFPIFLGAYHYLRGRRSAP